MKLAWKQIAVALVLGGGAGFVIVQACPLGRFHHRDRGHFQQRLLDRFSSKLQLTPEQRSRVATILEAKHQKIDALRAEIRPRFEEIRTSTSAEIRPLLTPEQQKRFDVMEAEWKDRRKQVHDRWREPEDAS